ncbi:MAG: 3'(2'),5'-bisphosphate nucleotidase CysQ [Pseudomonadota bacterium]
MPETDLALLTRAALAAGEVALRFFRADATYWDKGDGQGPVSEADLAVNTLLRETLGAARPDYGWLSEESDDDAARLGARRVFVIDPIDGTRAFLDGHENFSHSLAVVEDGVPVAGVVHLPAKGQTYAATRGAGATLNGHSIAPTGRRNLAGARVLAARPTWESRHWPQGVPDVKRAFRSSLAYRLATVAAGRFDAMITLRNCWEWDLAAGDVICREAGARVATVAGALPAYNSPGAQVPGIVAATPDVGAALLSQVRR